MNFFTRLTGLTRNQKIGAIIILCALIGGAVYSVDGGNIFERFAPKVEYSEVYTLVPDTISERAAVPMRLPEGVALSPSEAAHAVTFTPELKGTWKAGTLKNTLFYEPSAQLTRGAEYTVALTLPEGTLEKNFRVDEDPKVLAVFPKADGEAPETSTISIAFNRPMVPLTTLDERATKDIPVAITPDTKGSFKWISTRILQFVPETRLARSQHYTVSIKKGLISVDGLEVPPAEYSFTTKNFRFAGESIHHEGSTVHSEPVLIRFNQPVNLEATRAHISVVNSTGAAIPFALEYGTREVFNDKNGKYETFIDKSVLAVFNAQDAHGREKLWDALGIYTVSVAGAVGAEGDIQTNDFRQVTISVPSYIAGISATSPRSTQVSREVFDPQGKLVVQFFEDIDKDASSISAPGLISIEYGEKCKTEDGYDYYYTRNDCQKVADKTKLILSFDPSRFTLAQKFNLEFRKLVDSHGVTINPSTLSEPISTYPAARILSTTPAASARGASVREMHICSVTPLSQPKEEEFYKKITANNTLGKWNWGASHLVGPNEQNYSKCNPREFETVIYYGLQPETDYIVNLELQDDFGQVIAHTVSFTTEPIQSVYRKITPLQKAYNVTTPEKTNFTFAAENLEYVDAHICKISPETMLNYMSGYDTKPGETTPGSSLPCLQTFTKRIELPKIYWEQNYFKINLRDIIGGEALGHYVLTLSHPSLTAQTFNNQTQRLESGRQLFPHTFVSITRLAVAAKNIRASSYGDEINPTLLAKTSGNLYWVTEIGSQKPVANASVGVYRVSYGVTSDTPRITRAFSVLTGRDGVARTEVGEDLEGVIVASGADSAIVSGSTDKFQWGYGEAPAVRTYLYTDRPIYRPTQEVFFKGLTRLGYDGDYEIWREKPVTATLFGPTGESLGIQTLSVSEYGTFSGSFKLVANAPLGSYRIETKGGTGYFDVEEYKPAAFKVDMQSNKDEYVAGDTLNVNLSADYYFGVPIEKGEVEYSIVSQNYYFDRYQDEYFNFGGGWYYSAFGGYGDSFVTRGKVFLDEKGKATLAQKLDFETLFKNDAQKSSKIFVVRATVKNSSGQSISSEKSFVVHRADIYLGAVSSPWYTAKGQPVALKLKSVDTQGNDASLRGIKGEVYKITWESFKRQEVDGRFYYSTEEKRELAESFTISTDSRGIASRNITPKAEGHYEAVFTARDSRGNPIETSTSFYVSGNDSVSVRPNNNETLDLLVNKTMLNVGDVGSFVIQSPYKSAKALITLERGQIFDYKIIDITQSLFNYSFAVGEEHIPNVYASVVLLSPDPEVKYGQVDFSIGTSEKELEIGVKTDKNNYLPGETVQMTIETKNKKGQFVPAEVSVAVADLSVLALKGNPKKNPVMFFYGGLPLAVNTASNIKNVLEEAEIPTGTKGGGGLTAAELAKKKRGVFKDTAFWNATVRTGTSGVTTFSFTLPDNLTTWQAEAVGITTDTKVGSGYSEVMAKKPISLTPLIPRFIIPGDTFMAGAKVINDSDSSARLTVSLATSDFESRENSRSITVRAHDTETVYFESTAPQNPEKESLSLTLTAENSDYKDAVDQMIPVGKTSFFETTATASFSTASLIKEFVYVPNSVLKEKGGLTVTAESSLVPYMGDALKYLMQYPYGCTEQLASKLAAIAILEKHTRSEGENASAIGTIVFEGQTYTANDLITIGLDKIARNQKADGGFGYYPDSNQSSYSLTLAAVEALHEIRSAGHRVDENMVRSATNYIYARITDARPEYRLDNAGIVMGIDALSHEGGIWNQDPYFTYFNGKLSAIAANRAFLNDQASNSLIATLARISGRGYLGAYQAQLFAILENRMSLDARGAFITSGTDGRLYDYYETTEKNTALYLQALIGTQKSSVVEDNIVRWLIARKTKANGWGTTNSTLAVLEALSDFVTARHEKDSTYSLTINLGSKNIVSTQLPTKEGEIRVTKTVPLSEIEKNTIVPLGFAKTDTNKNPGTLYYSAELTYALPTEKLAPRDEGFLISRAFFAQNDTEYQKPLTSAKVGEVLRGHITLTVPKDRTLVAIEDYIPAGMELVNFSLSTEDQSLNAETRYDGVRGSTGGIGNLAAGIFGLGTQELKDSAYGPRIAEEKLYPDNQEIHDDRLFLFKEKLSPGVYTFDYYARALIPGTFNHLPAVASQLYAPEVFGRTAGQKFSITQ